MDTRLARRNKMAQKIRIHPGKTTINKELKDAVRSKPTATTKPSNVNQRGMIPVPRQILDVVKTNIAAIRIEKTRSIELPYCGNWRASNGSIGASVSSTLAAMTENEAPAPNRSAVKMMPHTN